MTPSSPPDAPPFRFLGHDFDPERGVLALRYGLGDGTELVERLHFPDPPWSALDPTRRAALDACFRRLHLVAGVSYYKATLPAVAHVDDGALYPSTARYVEVLYREGLRELAYRNGLDLGDRPRLEPVVAGPVAAPPDELSLPRRSLVAIGGGKDSLASVEALKALGETPTVIWVGGSALIGDTARASGCPGLRIERRLDPKLFALNRAAAYNGHVPITGIVSWILICAAVLYGYDAVILSNERSAAEGNLRLPDGGIVNHQYSKGPAAEDALREELATIVGTGVQCFSLLRGLSELSIAGAFSAMDRYHGVFSSCNANFRINAAEADGRRWCGSCPKCRFVYLALAPFMGRREPAAIVGADLLDDPDQTAGYAALLGLDGDKPFECVGAFEESRAALLMLAADPAWSQARVVRALGPRVRAAVDDPEAVIERALRPSVTDSIPSLWRPAADWIAEAARKRAARCALPS